MCFEERSSFPSRTGSGTDFWGLQFLIWVPLCDDAKLAVKQSSNSCKVPSHLVHASIGGAWTTRPIGSPGGGKKRAHRSCKEWGRESPQGRETADWAGGTFEESNRTFAVFGVDGCALCAHRSAAQPFACFCFRGVQSQRSQCGRCYVAGTVCEGSLGGVFARGHWRRHFAYGHSAATGHKPE